MTKEKKPKGWLIYTIFFIISIITSVFAIYEILLLSSIENLIRYLVIAIVIHLLLLFFLFVSLY